MADQSTMYRWDGSYNFKRREDWDYKHSYTLMAGMLGQEEVKETQRRKKKMGTVDEQAPPLPQDTALVETIEKTAKHIHRSNDPAVFEHLIQDKNKGKPGWSFLQEGGEGFEYYKFCRHCCEREVDPRPLALHARKVKEDREIKQANAKANVFTGYQGADIPKKTESDAKFKTGELMEVVGVKSKPDYNGKIVRVLKFHPEADRYEVQFEGGRYDSVVVKLKEENLMYSAMQEKEVQETKDMPEGEIPNGTKVEVRGLQSETAKWMNGLKAIVVCWDKDTERYEVRLSLNNDIKKVKPPNLRLEVPDGWQEHWDEHLGRHYYVNQTTQKVTWKHPTVTNQRAKFGQVKEKLDPDLEDIEIDHERKHYEVDEQEEMEGQFNLQALVKKVEEQEERREKAEETGQDVDSDDGLHDIAKPKKKKAKKEKVTAESIMEKALLLIEHTFVGRESIKKDYSRLDGNFCARDLDPIIKKWEALERVSEAPDSLCKETFEVMLALIQRGAELLKELSQNRLQLSELNKVMSRVTTLEKREDLLEDAKWVHSFMKTL
ncbi:unnamed protein product [Symbiodinium pilosum]|uniref:WW domain-containing protein n=1 Tax=Symbiodinium pilosum TaxID=2952 RepID=A0A812KTJ4_SYMPI|nr:unnamed protein product [Symbiodinium pilosum]